MLNQEEAVSGFRTSPREQQAYTQGFAEGRELLYQQLYDDREKKRRASRNHHYAAIGAVCAVTWAVLTVRARNKALEEELEEAFSKQAEDFSAALEGL